MNLKEELLEGYNQYCDEQIDQYIVEQFRIYLQSEGIELTEDMLQEGKILNSIRWKLAKFSLRFLKEKAIDEFLLAYYSDKNNKPTEKGKEWVKKSKKEKVKKMRELADMLKDEDKQKVINVPGAKELERTGIINGVTGAISLGAGVASGIAASNLNNIQADGFGTVEGTVRNDIHYNRGGGYRDANGNWNSLATTSKGKEIKFGDGGTYGTSNDIMTTRNVDDTSISVWDKDGKKLIARSGGIDSSVTITARIASGVMSIIGAVTGQLWLVMVGSLIVGGVSAFTSLRSFNKANVLRRDEMLQQLKSKRDLKEEYIHYLINKAQNI